MVELLTFLQKRTFMAFAEWFIGYLKAVERFILPKYQQIKQPMYRNFPRGFLNCVY